MHPLVNIAVGAARQAGSLLLRSQKRVDTLKVHSKGRNDWVTEADIAAEQVIIEHIHKHYPDHAILGEESGALGESDHVWIIDPLDGTTNFIHGFPVFAVSIGIQVKGRLEHGVVYDPMRDEIFSASRGEGAQLDGRRIRVSGARKLDEALVGTGFPYREDQDGDDRYVRQLQRVLTRTAGVRRPGAAALDLAYVAAGRLDGFWEYHLKPWDIAAGAVLIREAGGIVTAIDGGDDFLEPGHVLAASAKLYPDLLRLLAQPR
ncbi:MAG: inositol monophosphatase family protein [Pseudomonadota bacterium]